MTQPRGDQPVHRLSPLPSALGRGRLLVAEAVLAPTSWALRTSRGADGPHEGIVLWLGRKSDDDTTVMAATVPDSDHTWGSVRMGHAAVARAARSARRLGLVVVAQVHSHPGDDTRHQTATTR